MNFGSHVAQPFALAHSTARRACRPANRESALYSSVQARSVIGPCFDVRRKSANASSASGSPGTAAMFSGRIGGGASTTRRRSRFRFSGIPAWGPEPHSATRSSPPPEDPSLPVSANSGVLGNGESGEEAEAKTPSIVSPAGAGLVLGWCWAGAGQGRTDIPQAPRSMSAARRSNSPRLMPVVATNCWRS